MKKIYIFLIVIAIILVIGLFFGLRLAGVLGALGIGGSAAYKKKQQKKKEKAKSRIEKAGDDVEKKHHDNADSAANKLDDVLDNSDSE